MTPFVPAAWQLTVSTRARCAALWLPARVTVFLVALLALGCASTGGEPDDLAERDGEQVRGSVFVDLDGDGVRSPGERGVPGVAVSDGERVVRTDRDGAWVLPAHPAADYFVIKPSGMRTRLDANNLPRFYYLQREQGSPDGLTHTGLPPTGPPPARIDFPLYEQHEASPFRVLVVGDPQPRSLEDIEHFGRDILPELASHDAAFGISLGDIVHDDLALYPPLIDAMGLVGLPWFHVYGNHDMNLDAPSRETAGATFERYFGPRTYAFEYADVHFVLLDNIDFRPATEDEPVGYRGGLDERTLAFIENYAAVVPPDEQIVLLMHIPLIGDRTNQVPQRDRLFEILEGHEFSWSISAHTHMQAHVFLHPELDATARAHHHWNSGTASGSWWRGRRDEYGIPHTTMRDGVPNGYSIVTFDGPGYSIRFKAARRPADHQIAIHAPDSVTRGSRHTIYANVFAGSERSHVTVRVVGSADDEAAGDTEGQREDRTTMARRIEPDPAFKALRKRENEALAKDEKSLPGPNPSHHLWRSDLLFEQPAGSYWIEVESVDMFGQRDSARRIVRVLPADAEGAASD
ncbi:MAG: calcineurin-like phosphoesterase family protein [Myxococcota bacterium]|jgi:hypothetical protein|nr:calcineurin-like phosphoesterase family protein [Myxococcota bacterium]